MRDKFRPDEIYISSGSDEQNNLMSLQKLLEEIRPFSGRFFQHSQNSEIGVLEQFANLSGTSIWRKLSSFGHPSETFSS